MDVWGELFGTIGLWVIPLMILAWEVFLYIIRKKESTTFEKTVDAVKSIYDELPIIEQLSKDLYYTHMPIGFNPPVIDPYNVSNRVKHFRNLASTSKVFLSTEISNNLDSICIILDRITNNLGMREIAIQSGETNPMLEEMEKEAFELLNDKLPSLSSQLEKTFKELLGTSNQ